LNDTDAALAIWLQLLQADPNYVGMYYHLGKLYETKNQADNALRTYRDGMIKAKNIGDMHAYSELAGAKLNLSDDDE
jgi:Tfp pilus assembly protein PilF